MQQRPEHKKQMGLGRQEVLYCNTQAHLLKARLCHTLSRLFKGPVRARLHVSALCWPWCLGLEVLVQKRRQLITGLHLSCLMRTCKATCKGSVEKGNVHRCLEGVVRLVLLVAPAPHALPRRELLGKDLLKPVPASRLQNPSRITTACT